MSADTVTIAVMARAPVPGRCKTRLARGIGADDAARLYSAMLEDRIDAVGSLDVRRVILAAPEDDGLTVLGRFAPAGWEVVAQRGDDLGARLANGLRDVFRPGARACFVDSDSPTLRLDETRLASSTADVVLGPCEDGGYSLIGLRRLEPRVFASIPWSTSQVLEATRMRCRELALSVDELEPWFDVDEPDDLVRLGRELEANPSLAPRTAALLREQAWGHT